MKKIMISGAVLMILLVVGYLVIVNIGINKYNEANDSLKELVGEQVVLKGDTLMVVDYSLLNGTVTLDDGREVNTELVKKLLED